MKKSDCVMIFICVVFLLFSLGAIGQAGRENARILACAAAEKQIAGIITAYQKDNDGFVPVMLHKASISLINAKSSLLSLPFLPYWDKPVNLMEETGNYLNPDEPWDIDQAIYYFENFLPKSFVCPFVRGSEAGSWWDDTEVIQIAPGAPTRTNYKTEGLNDSYSTWIWPRDKGFVFWPNHPYGPEYGKNKYGNVQWHSAGNPTGGCYIDIPSCYEKLENRPVRFSDISGISELTAAHCAQGELDESVQGRIFNYGSHKRGSYGGTNVIFGDMHVEWVASAQITAGN
ncbi:MAG: hypothetical protein PHP01_03730 [Phycisphaerae bacterium]|nr:hypothetical protein [Phycisphaerae bacterium]